MKSGPAIKSPKAVSFFSRSKLVSLLAQYHHGEILCPWRNWRKRNTCRKGPLGSHPFRRTWQGDHICADYCWRGVWQVYPDRHAPHAPMLNGIAHFHKIYSSSYRVSVCISIYLNPPNYFLRYLFYIERARHTQRGNYCQRRTKYK